MVFPLAVENISLHDDSMEEGINPDSKKFNHITAQWLFAGLIVSSLLVLILLTMTRPRNRGHNHTEAVNNARQIGLALLEFEQSYDCYPNDSTPPQVTASTGCMLTLGNASSNDYFRQLMAAEITQSEALFYAKIPNSKKPDNNIEHVYALAKGECGFSYILGTTKTTHPETPVVVTPLIPGTTLFDDDYSKKYLAGKAVILCKDGSVQSLPIDKAGRVWINGKDLFDPTQPFWNGKAPVVKWPDL